MGAQLHQTHADLVAEIGRITGTRFAQGHRHGCHHGLGWHTAVIGQIAAQRGGTNPQRDIVEAAADCLAHGLAVGQWHRGRRKHPVLRDGCVEGAFRCQLDRHFRPAAVSLQRLFGQSAQGVGDRRQGLGQLGHLRQRVGKYRANHFADFQIGCCLASARRVRRRHCARHRPHVQHRIGQHHSALAVQCGMVNFREKAADELSRWQLDCVEHIKLPQRMGTVNQFAVQPGHQGVRLRQTHWFFCGTGHTPDVKVNIH